VDKSFSGLSLIRSGGSSTRTT